MSVESIRRDAEELAQYVGWVALVVVGIAVTYTFGLFLAAGGVHNFLHHFPEGSSHSRLTGIELAIVPLSAIAAAWLRPGADRIRALRETWAGPWLPLLMAATLVGLCTWLVWSWLLPQASFGPDQFGYARWLGTALAAAFTIFWLPLFPRLTAILAGMIAGPALIAGIGYIFFGSSPIVCGQRALTGPAAAEVAICSLFWPSRDYPCSCCGATSGRRIR